MEHIKRKKLGLMPLEKRLMLDASLPAMTGQVLWLDAADTSTIRDAEGDNAASGAFSGSVATWVDKSGSGFNVTNATAGEQPSYGGSTQNGRGVITFDGTADRLTNASASILGDDVTIFAVFNRTTATGRDAVLDIGGGTNRNGIFVNNGGTNQINYLSDASFNSTVSTYTANTYALFSLIHDTTSVSGWVNGAAQLSGTGALRDNTTGLTIGDDSTSGDQFQGNIAEIIVYNRDLTAEERHDVETYLASKWGLTITNTGPTVDTNTGRTVNQGGSVLVQSIHLASSDADNTDTSLIYTITDATDLGNLVNTNTGQTLGVGSTFTQADLSSNYINFVHSGVSGPSDSFSFTVTDQYATTAVNTFTFTVNPVNQAPVISGWTLVSSENFESGATGWSDNTTETSTPYLSRFLGRHSMEGGAQSTFKTYTLSGTQDQVVVTFDFYEIDSWDGEAFRFFVDDNLVFSSAFQQGIFNSPADGANGPVSWTVQELTPFNANGAFGAWNDQVYRFTLTINSTASAVKLGFTSTLDQPVSDEAWGVDNINIYEVGNGVNPGPFGIAENSANGTAVGVVTATDLDASDTLTYSITGGSGASYFSINAATGVITVSNSAGLDYEATAFYTLNVQVSDNGAPVASDTATIIINLLDIPENTAPVLNPAGPFTVAENTANNTVIGSVSATDAQSHTITYSITGGNTGGVFAINASTGAIRILNNAALDYEGTPSYTLTITTTDNGFGTLSSTTNVTINVTDLNEAPSFDPVQAILTSDPTLHYNATTGNFYRYVSAATTLAGAQAAAGAYLVNGIGGHLATITTAAENSFVTGLIGANAWLDGSDTGIEGQWRWMSGPDAGFMFWNGGPGGSVQNGLYANWMGGDPDDAGGNQDAIQLRTNGTWTDVADSGTAAYVIEWEGAAVMASLQNGPYTLAENATAGVSVGFAHSSDPDLGDTRTYSVTGGTGAGLFAINAATGEITLTGVVDYETATSYTLDLHVEDAAGLFDTRTVTINITNVNEAPVVSPAGPFAFNENTASGTSVTTISASDPDAGNTLTYSIQSGNTGGMFSIVSTTGALSFTGSPDFESVSSYSLVIRVTDNNGAFTDQTVTVNINDLNEAPVLSAAGPFAVNENVAAGTAVTTMTATDQDVGQTITYTIQSGNTGGMFAINSSTGALTFASSPNFENISSYNLVIRATDNGTGSLYSEQTVTININDVNESPTLNPAGPFTFNENVAAGTVVTTMSSSDPDTAQTRTYSIQSGNTNNTFAINGATGVITFLSSPNYELASTYNLVIRVTDNGTGALFAQQTVTVNITNLNEAPSFDPVQAILNANPALRYNATTGNFYQYITAATNLAAARTAASAALINGQAGHLATITSAAENAFLTSIITSSAWIDGSDAATEGSWYWMSGPEAGQMFWLGNGAGSAQNGFYTNWNGGEPNDSGGEDGVQLLTSGRWNDINVGANYTYIIEWEGASLIAPLQNGPYTIAENSASGTSVGFAHASDPDAGDTRTFSITGGTGAGLFAINATTGEITLAGSVDYEAGSSYTLNLRVQDTAGLFDTTTVTINIADLNEVPVLSPAGPFTFNENVAPGTAVTTMSASDQDGGQTLTYTIQSGNTGGMFAINSATGAFTFAGSPDFETVNSYSLVIRVTDNGTGALYAEQTVTVNITDLNEVPVLNAAGPFTFSENVAVGTTVTTMSASDQDAGQTLTYSIQSGNTGGMFAINSATGAITFVGSPDFDTLSSYNLVVRVTDNGAGSLYAEQTVTVNITDLNEAPVLNPAGPFAFNENTATGTSVTTMTSSDQDAGQTLTYSIQSGNTGGMFAINSATGEITFAGSPDFETTGSYALVIRVTDNGTGSLYAEQTVNIAINDLNEVPVLNPAGPFTIPENVAPGTVVTTMAGSDQDGGQTLTYTIQSGNTGGMFTINASTGVLSFAGSPNFEALNFYSLVIRVTDNGTGTLYAEQTVDINITDVNDVPSDLTLSHNRVTENSSVGTLIGTLATVDQDPADTHIYSLVTNPGTKFIIVGNEIRTAGDIDYELNQTFSVTIRTDDGNGGTFDRTFTIFVSDEADTFTPPPSVTPPVTVDRPVVEEDTDLRSASLIRASLQGGESGQMLAFYGLGEFHQILRENMTFEVWDMTAGEGAADIESQAVYYDAEPQASGKAETMPEQTDRFTNLREALKFFEQLKNAGEAEKVEGGAESLEHKSDTPERDIPANTIDRQFVDVLTYHEQRQARLREALKSA